MPIGHTLHPSILRAYDIRGIVGETLFPEDVFAIGYHYACTARAALGVTQPRICVARDGRLSSPELCESLTKGLMSGGAQVLECGLGPTPMLYHAVYSEQADGGLMLTGSHNPPTHNGIKMMLAKGSFFGDAITALGERIAHEPITEVAGGGRESVNARSSYTQALLKTMEQARGLTLVWDAGNGAAGEVVQALAEQNAAHTHHTLFTEIDGTFPNHHPDPSVPENLKDLRDAVSKHSADIGLAFDGDGDRLGVVDDLGRTVESDHLLILLARDVLTKYPKSTAIADVKTSGIFFEDVRAYGGEAIMYKTGHSHIKSKMKEIGAAFAGEASGHIFFADEYYGFDDGLYAAIRLVNYVASTGMKLSALVDELPTPISTPELRLDVEETAKFAIIDAVREGLEQAGADMNTIDGVRVNTPEGWWLLRASNTQAALIARCESTSESGLETLKTALKDALSDHAVKLPF